MNQWNSVVFLRSSKPWSEISKLCKWDGVESVWSTSGDWDWCVKLNSKFSSPEHTEAFVSKVRDGHWAMETKSQWWKNMHNA